jgi:hypothetical protein
MDALRQLSMRHVVCCDASAPTYMLVIRPAIAKGDVPGRVRGAQDDPDTVAYGMNDGVIAPATPTST